MPERFSVANDICRSAVPAPKYLRRSTAFPHHYIPEQHTAMKAGRSERMKYRVLMPLR